MDAKPIFEWAHQNGESKIVDRILVRVLPDLMHENIKVTSETIHEMTNFDVPQALFEKIKMVAEEMVGQAYRA